MSKTPRPLSSFTAVIQHPVMGQHLSIFNSHANIPILPAEVYLHIFRLAIWVPEACDTSFDVIEGEVHETALNPILKSMATKRSLYMVSKMFNSLMERFLYECIFVFRIQTIPALLDRLQSIPKGYDKPRGHLCRRLDLCFGTMRRESSYLDESWYEGGHTLWGLIPACPHLEVLIAHVNRKEPGGMWIEFPHLTHNALWKTISTYCSRTLRRLELLGFSIRMDRVEIMLECLTSLEVCKIVHCEPYQHFDFEKHHKSWLWDADNYDDEEPTNRECRYYKGIKPPPKPIIRQSRDDRTHSGLFKDDIVAEFDEALEKAQWPPHSRKVYLPNLHTLFLDQFTERFFNFDLPNLRKLATTDVYDPNIMFCTKRVTYGYGHPNFLRMLFCLPKFKTFSRPKGNKTIFGGFPRTITHLDIPFDALTLDRVLFFFPGLTHLTWSRSLQFPMEVSPSMTKNTTLQYITLNCHNNYYGIRYFLNAILDALRMGKLLALSEVRIDWKFWRADWEPPKLALEEFAAFGIVVKKSIVKPSRLTSHYF